MNDDQQPAELTDEPCVLVRVDLRPSTYRAYDTVAKRRGTTVAALLSKAADRVVHGDTLPTPVVQLPKKKRLDADELERLRSLHAEGMYDAQIARTLHRSQATVLNARRRLGLPQNASPERKAAS